MLLLVGIGIDVFETVSVWAIDLLIPGAALLGQRYGQRGLVVVALGGLPCIIQWRYSALFGGGCLDIYIASMIVCALAGSLWPHNGLHQRRFSWAYFLAFLFLPLSLGLYTAEGYGDASFQLVLQLKVLLYLFLFMLGVAGYYTRFVVATIAAFTLVGILLELLQLPGDAQALFGGTYAELPLFGYTELRTLWMEYGLDNPAMFFTAIGWFGAGKQVASMLETHEAAMRPWYRSYPPVVLLTLVGLGWETNTYLASAITGNEPSPAFMLLGSFYALPCAALMGGLLLRWRGVLLVLLLYLVFLVLDALIRADFDIVDPRFLIYVRDPTAVLGFGALGIGLRNRILGTHDVWWSWQWASYIVIMVAVLPVFFSLDSALGFLWLLLTLIGSVVIGKWLAALRKRYLGWLPTHGGWLALLGLLAFVIVGLRAQEFIGQMFAIVHAWTVSTITSVQAGEDWYAPEGEEFMALMFLLIGCALFFTVLQRFLRDAAACGHDIRAMIRSIQRKPRPDEVAVPPVQNTSRMLSAWARIRSVITDCVTVARNVVAVIIIAVLVIQSGVMLYPQDGMVATLREWLATGDAEINGVDADIVASDIKVNPWLWQAVRETFAQIPATVNAREGLLATDWYTTGSESDVRQRVDVRVGEEMESYALSVNLRRQQKGLFGLWVEQDSYWDPRKGAFVGVDPYPLQQELADRLLARAQELAGAIPQ
jgi:hypothetical protein